MRSVLLHRRGDYVPWEEGFDFTPPEPAAGEVVGPPDFVGVGVQKAGTSWWYELIIGHPDVFSRPDVPKERHYLTRFCVEPFGEAERQRYHGWFPRVPGTITGEWTPDYFGYPWIPPVLASAAPDAKVLLLLRDPVERFRSGLTFRLRQGAPATVATVADAYRQGLYVPALRNLLDHVSTERVLVLQYEQCRIDPAGQLAATYRFLGLEEFRPSEIRREVNVSGGDKIELADDARRRLVEHYRPDVEELASLVPTLDMSLWTNFTRDAG